MRSTMMKNVIVSGVLLYCFSMLAVADAIELKGVFLQKAAVLVVKCKQRVLNRGESKDGVTLEEVHSDHVKLRVEGELRTVFMSRQAGAEYKPLALKNVRIPIGEGGHYWVNGLIHDKPVKLVVDTGATLVAMNVETATSLGIDYKNGQRAKMNTANGSSEARVVKLKSIQVGDIKQFNIDAIVALNNSLPFLGNSFLNKVDITQRNSVMTLSSGLCGLFFYL